jgi:hypothetical protein
MLSKSDTVRIAMPGQPDRLYLVTDTAVVGAGLYSYELLPDPENG